MADTATTLARTAQFYDDYVIDSITIALYCRCAADVYTTLLHLDSYPGCARPILPSATPAEPLADILSILGSSSASRNHPSTPQPQPRATASDTSLSKAARSLGLTNSSHRQALQESTERASFQKHIYRRWASGDVYSPHDLTPAEQKKWKAYRKAPSSDAFDTLGLNPINEYKVFTADTTILAPWD